MDSDSNETRLERAAELLDAGKPAAALRCLEGVQDGIFEASEQIECASLSAWALSELDRADEAIELLQPLLEQHPDSSRLHGTMGMVLSAADRLDDACDMLETAVSLDQTDGVLLANLGYVHEQLHDGAAASRLYDRSLQNGADVDWVLRRLATVQSDMDDHAAARGTLRRYLSLFPEDSAEWISLAIAHSELGEFDESLECYQRAESLGADEVSLNFNWGLTAERAGQMETAHERLRRLERIAADSPQTSGLRGFILEHEGDLPSAYECHFGAIDLAVGDYAEELVYTYETAMDFCAEHKMHGEAEELLPRAYRADACSVDFCQAYRELTGEALERAYWLSVMIRIKGSLREAGECDTGRSEDRSGAERNFQVIARDRDHAAALLTEFTTRVGETEAALSEFVGEESMEDTHSGIYEVEPRRRRRP